MLLQSLRANACASHANISDPKVRFGRSVYDGLTNMQLVGSPAQVRHLISALLEFSDKSDVVTDVWTKTSRFQVMHSTGDGMLQQYQELLCRHWWDLGRHLGGGR